jgi:hypothetical protein
MRGATELLIDDGDQIVERLPVAAGPTDQQICDVAV